MRDDIEIVMADAPSLEGDDGIACLFVFGHDLVVFHFIGVTREALYQFI